MKAIYCFFIFLLLISCHSSSEENINLLDYIWTSETGEYRQYRYTVDSMASQIFITQRKTQNTDSSWVLTYTAVRSDSIPLFTGKELYRQNTFELLENSLFEIDPKTNIVLEVKGKIVKKAFCSLNKQPCSYNIEFKSKVIPLISNVDLDIKFEFHLIDSLKFSTSPYLVCNTFEKVHGRDLVKQKDTIIEVRNIRIYAKGKGMVLFTQDMGKKKAIYKLIE